MNAATVEQLCSEIATQCLCFNLRKASRVVTQYYDEALRASGLRATQFALLVVMRGLGPATLNELARSAGMDRTTVSRNLKPLEKLGFVKVGPGRDRRTRIAEVSVSGKQAIDAGVPLWREAQQQLVARIGDNETTQLLAGLANAERVLTAAELQAVA